MSEINYHVLQKAGLRRYFESLQMVLMGRFCNFSKSKTVNCHMQACVRANRVKGRDTLIQIEEKELSPCRY